MRVSSHFKLAVLFIPFLLSFFIDDCCGDGTEGIGLMDRNASDNEMLGIDAYCDCIEIEYADGECLPCRLIEISWGCRGRETTWLIENDINSPRCLNIFVNTDEVCSFAPGYGICDRCTCETINDSGTLQ